MSIEILTKKLHRLTLNGPAMGSRWSAVFFAESGFDAETLRLALAQTVEGVEQEMSTWRRTSDLSRFNAAPVGQWIDLPERLAKVIEAGLVIGRHSHGAFDIGVGDLVRVWGFGGGSRTPDLAGIAAGPVLNTANRPQNLQLDVPGRRARKLAPLSLDLNGIAKGFGVDELARVMADFGIVNFLVGIDGEMRAAGMKADGLAWSIGVERPARDRRELMSVLELVDCAVATSGNYRHVHEIDGESHAHTMDPTTGKPLQNRMASLTVLAPTCMEADAYATALMVLGESQGLALARELGLKVIFVLTDGEVISTLA